MVKKIFSFCLFLMLSLEALGGSLPSIVFMHGLKEGDFLEKKLSELVENYNNSPNAQGHVLLKAGGDYNQSFEKLLSREVRPHLAMVSEVHSMTMYNTPDLYVPIENVLNVKEISFLPVIQTFYNFGGKMVSYPFNCSAPVLYYNRDAFKKAGLPDRAPQTWEEIEACSQKLVAAGCGGFTFAWPAAYALEHFAVVHNIPFATHHNGFENPEKATISLKNPAFIAHLTFLQNQAKKGCFTYAGERAEDAEQLFLDGKVAILMQGANRAQLIQKKNPHLKIGVGPYPYKAALIQKPYAPNIGGTSIWVINAHPADRRVVADFLKYLSSAEVQAKWHQETSYLPVTREAFELTKKSGFYRTHPAARIGVEQIERLPQNLPHGVRLLNYGERRKAIVAMLGRIFVNQAPVAQEVDALVRKDKS